MISLKESIKRRTEFDKLNKKYIKYKYFDAINGNTLPNNIDNILNKNASGYKKGAVGCAMSHLNLWNKCIENNKPMIIMEDDVFVSKDFNKHLQSIMDMLPEKWHILQLCYNCDSILGFSNTNFEDAYTFFTKKKFDDNDIEVFQNSEIHPTIARLKMSFGMSCYIITPLGANILKQKCFPMDNRIINIPLAGQVKSYTLDIIMNDIYKNIDAYVCPIPFVMPKHLHINYKSTVFSSNDGDFTKKTKPNEKCPCGSGKKYKKCCRK